MNTLGEPLLMKASMTGGKSALAKYSRNRERPLSAPVLLMPTPTTAPTTAPSTTQPRPPVATVTTTAAVAKAVTATLAAISRTPPKTSASMELCRSASPSRAAQGVSVMRNDPCLKKTRIKSRSGRLAQVRLSETLVGVLLRLIGQTLHSYAEHLQAAGVNALLYCGPWLFAGAERGGGGRPALQ